MKKVENWRIYKVFLTGKKIVNMNLTNGPKIQQIEIEDHSREDSNNNS